MGRVVQADPAVEERGRELLKSKLRTEVGLLVGQISQGKDFVSTVVCTPVQSEAATADRLASLDQRWFAEHARQITRMLPGGVHVIGLFVYGPAEVPVAQAVTIKQLCSAISRLHQSPYASVQETAGDQELQPLFLHICSNPLKFTCRSVETRPNKSGMWPAELKFAKFSSKGLQFKTTVTVTVALPIPSTMERAADLEKLLRVNLERQVRWAFTGAVLLDGDLVPDPSTYPISKLPSKDIESRTVHIFTPLSLAQSDDVATNACLDAVSAQGWYHYQGTVSALCLCYNPKATMADVLKVYPCQHDFPMALMSLHALCSDAVKTTLARLEVLLEEEHSGDTAAPISSSPLACSAGRFAALPRRIFAVCEPTGIPLSDYALQEENTSDSKSRLGELLGQDFPASTVAVSPERPPAPSELGPISSPRVSARSGIANKAESSRTEPSSGRVDQQGKRDGDWNPGRLALLAVVAAVLSIAVAFSLSSN